MKPDQLREGLSESDLFRVEKWDLDPERAPEPRRVIYHKRVMWCAVGNREAYTVGDTDTYICELGAHKLGEDGCMFRDMLVLGYERD